MAKRKQQGANDDDSDGSDSDVSLIDVDFDFFNLNPDVDYQAIKRLSKQLFQADAERFRLHDLTELVLAQEMGTTVKTDGQESDPYAILTVINIHANREHPSIRALVEYALSKSGNSPVLKEAIEGPGPVGFVLCERLINMPVQVIPPMYRMLTEEMKAALTLGKPYAFTHLLFISRAYHLTPEEESFLVQNSASRPKTKKSKKASRDDIDRPSDGIYSFHPEDDVIAECAVLKAEYKYDGAEPVERNKESFGLDNRGRIMLVKGDRFEDMVHKMVEKYSAI